MSNWPRSTLLLATGSSPVGISAPQGCGKTTLVEQLQQLFSATGSAAASVSVDDFYLTFKYRGNAGSHDLQLGSSSLRALRGLRQPGQTAAVPRSGVTWV
ncbi:uncharacterized protein HaLaN_16219 [Haematococcus lacustris]|uniref:Uncharacterized protein n=1 Tax=Haematococcus lacustris TaxID=44745 RepID=A0A699Z9J2_HAELA|nr:uncharacterized protein HaLaN_16219 [Haematococcus lacustris]